MRSGRWRGTGHIRMVQSKSAEETERLATSWGLGKGVAAASQSDVSDPTRLLRVAARIGEKGPVHARRGEVGWEEVPGDQSMLCKEAHGVR
eukprot:6074989-Pleurochrysis_carterae.AAC.1